jgi:hypothetical protein
MAAQVEHFCTLFDSTFLPQALSLIESLDAHAGSYILWCITIDDEAAEFLTSYAHPSIRVIPLRDLETPALTSVKASRSRGEYCWTITPFTFGAVFDREPSATRVTYLDADLFFFSPPLTILNVFAKTGRDILVTPHAFAPEYDRGAPHGVFCVQFLTVSRSERARRVIDWWGKRCIEWCFDRVDGDKFGDQKYLDQWPTLFADTIFIWDRPEMTLAPWNVRHLFIDDAPPTFFHFHGLRRIDERRIRLFYGYKIGRRAQKLYQRYVASLTRSLALLGSRTPEVNPSVAPISRLRLLLLRIRGYVAYANLQRPV